MRYRALALVVGTGFFLMLGTAPIAWATLSQSFSSSSQIPPGSLVSLNASSTSAVDIATPNNANALFGVAVPPLTSAGVSAVPGQVQVATTGTADVLVTNTAGTIHIGDYLTISPISGVAELANNGGARVIGTARAGFSGSGTLSDTIKDASGKTRSVSIGQIPVDIAAANVSNTSRQAYAAPSWLQNFANTLAGKQVSTLRVMSGALILFMALISITILLYAAVRNSLISIGRNPLSRNSIYRGLLEVVAIATGIMMLSLAATYFVIVG